MKVYIPDSYYHLYNHGWNRTDIFLDDDDYRYFEYLLKRHLSPDPVKDKKGREYAHHYTNLRLNAYCLMPNHFHMLVYQAEGEAIIKLASSLFTAYTMYFNEKYRRRGSLFENTYKAVRINNDSQLMHITRYIHLNHKNYRKWKYSSYKDYLVAARDWVDLYPFLELFDSTKAYKEFVDDYEEVQRTRDAIKAEIANG